MGEYNGSIVEISDLKKLYEEFSTAYDDLNTSIGLYNLSNKENITSQDIPLYDTINLMASFISALSTFSDLIIQRGKDILLLADQSNPFICVSLDTFERVVDVWNFLTSGDLVDLLIPYNTLFDISKINSINELITNGNSQEIQDALNQFVIADYDAYNAVIITYTGLFKKSTDVVSVFKDVLSINTYTGIALSVTDQSAKLLNRMHKYTTKTVTSEIPEETKSANSVILENNELLPTLDNKAQLFYQYLSALMLTENSVIQNTHKYLWTFKYIDSPDALTLPTGYNKLGYDDIMKLKRPIPSGVVKFLKVSKLVNFNLTDKFLEWYPKADRNVELSVLQGYLDDAVLLSVVDRFKKYTISDYLAFREKYHNSILKSNNLKYYDIVVDTIPDDFFRFGNYQITDTKIGNLAIDEINQFLFDIYNDISISEEELNNYKSNIRLDSKTGQVTISQFSIGMDGVETFEKTITQYKFQYNIYRNDYYILYGEFYIAGIYYLLNLDTMQCLYVSSEKLPNDLTLIHTKKHNINCTYFFNTILNSDNLFRSYLTDFQDTILEELDDKIKGLYNTINYSISSEYNEFYTITSVSSGTVNETHYITDNPLERIASDITNIYREELINGRMDYTQARNYSIITTINYLQLRTKLDDYIDYTWGIKIKRY